MLNLKLIVLFCSLNIMVCYPDRSRKRPGKPNLNDVSIQTSGIDIVAYTFFEF